MLVRLPSTLSVAVAPGSVNVPPTVSIIAAAPLRVTTGAVVSTEGVLVAVVEAGVVEEAVLVAVEAGVAAVPVPEVEPPLEGAGPRFTVPSGFPTMTLGSAVALLPA